MASATKTKAQLEAENAQLRADLEREPKHTPVEATASLAAFEGLQGELEAALARIQELEAAAERPPVSNELTQVLWLQKNAPTGERVGYTGNGSPFIAFGAQYGRMEERSGERVFGAWKNFRAYGDLAEAITAYFRGTDRLARITAFEKPWHGRPAEGTQYPTRNSEWIVVGFEPMPRVDAQATGAQTAASVPGALEPTDEEIPF